MKSRVPTKYASWSMVLCNLLIPKTCWKCAFKTSRSGKRVRKNCVTGRRTPQCSRRKRIPLHETCSACEDEKNKIQGFEAYLYSHVKNRVVTSEKAKSQRANESSLPVQSHDQEISYVHSRCLLYAKRSPHTCYATAGRWRWMRHD